MLLTAKKAPGSSLPSPDRRESPRPGYFVALGFFPCGFRCFFSPKKRGFPRWSPVTGCLARRLRRGRFFFPFGREKEKKKIQKGERLPRRARLPAAAEPAWPALRGAAPSSLISHRCLSRAAAPGPARSLEKRDTETRLFNGKTSTNNVKLSMDGGRIV